MKAAPKFKKGDVVVVARRGMSNASSDYLSSSFEIYEVFPRKFGSDIITSGIRCSGYYAKKLEHSAIMDSPLWQELL